MALGLLEEKWTGEDERTVRKKFFIWIIKHPSNKDNFANSFLTANCDGTDLCSRLASCCLSVAVLIVHPLPALFILCVCCSARL